MPASRTARLLTPGILALALLAGCTQQVPGTPVTTSRAAGPPPGVEGAPEATVEGWKVVTAPERGASYDVPPSWTVESPDTVIGFQTLDESQQVLGRGAATYLDGYCDGAGQRSLAVVTGSDDPELASAASATAAAWAELAYLDAQDTRPVLEPAPPQPLQTVAIAGQVATVVVTPPQTDPCLSPTATVAAFAAPGDSGSVVVVLVVDQGFPGATTGQEIDQILRSVRPIE